MKKFLLIFLLFIPFQAFADVDMSHTFYLSVKNSTNKTFTYQKILITDPGNQFWFNNQNEEKFQIEPGKTKIIKGETVVPNDLYGEIEFVDQEGISYRLKIYVQEKRKVGQPEFYMFGENIATEVLSRKLNPYRNPRVLMYTEASIELKN